MTLTAILEHERCSLFQGDSAELGEVLPENSVDAIVTDPPSGTGFMGETWDKDKGGRAKWIAWLAGLLAPAYRALKPGGYGAMWCLPRTSHWTATAIEDAGFEIRDVHHDALVLDDALDELRASLDDVQERALLRVLESQSSPILYQIFGSGMPKSLDLMREVDMHLCTLSGRHYDKNLPASAKSKPGDHLCPEHPERERAAGSRRTGLKPAVEHWIIFRKPLEGTYAENLLAHGTGGFNVEACRVGERWPAHLSLDPACAAILDEQSGTLRSGGMAAGTPRGVNAVFGKATPTACSADIVASRGGAARFFMNTGDARFMYCSKPPRSEKDAGLDHLEASTGGDATGREDDSIGTKNPRAGAGRTGGAKCAHPTVKSVDFMRWLVRLVTPPGGVVLDMFAGSGTTGVAALTEGMAFVGVELGGDDGKYIPILLGRINHALEGAKEST